MCGRYTNEATPRKLVMRYQAANRSFKFQQNSNIAPTTMAPVVVMEDGKRILKQMKWGLIPSWAKDAKIGAKCFNARAETVHEKPSFRSSFKSRRCLVPATGFYEWAKMEIPPKMDKEDWRLWHMEHGTKKPPPVGQRKVPHKITVNGEQIFSFAGLWSRWAPAGLEPIESFTIITTEANKALKPIHPRMPVILLPDFEGDWIDPNLTRLEEIREIMPPFPAEWVAVERLEEVPIIS